MVSTKVRVMWSVWAMHLATAEVVFFNEQDAKVFCAGVSQFPGSHQVERELVIEGWSDNLPVGTVLS